MGGGLFIQVKPIRRGRGNPDRADVFGETVEGESGNLVVILGMADDVGGVYLRAVGDV